MLGLWSLLFKYFLIYKYICQVNLCTKVYTINEVVKTFEDGSLSEHALRLSN